MQETQEIDIRSTVNELIALHPETIAAFNRFGIDTCCGGGESVADAARRDGADLDELLAALREAIGQR